MFFGMVDKLLDFNFSYQKDGLAHDLSITILVVLEVA